MECCLFCITVNHTVAADFLFVTGKFIELVKVQLIQLINRTAWKFYQLLINIKLNKTGPILTSSLTVTGTTGSFISNWYNCFFYQ